MENVQASRRVNKGKSFFYFYNQEKHYSTSIVQMLSIANGRLTKLYIRNFN